MMTGVMTMCARCAFARLYVQSARMYMNHRILLVLCTRAEPDARALCRLDCGGFGSFVGRTACVIV